MFVVGLQYYLYVIADHKNIEIHKFTYINGNITSCISLCFSVRLYIIFEGWQIISMLFFYIAYYIIWSAKQKKNIKKTSCCDESRTGWNLRKNIQSKITDILILRSTIALKLNCCCCFCVILTTFDSLYMFLFQKSTTSHTSSTNADLKQ